MLNKDYKEMLQCLSDENVKLFWWALTLRRLRLPQGDQAQDLADVERLESLLSGNP